MAWANLALLEKRQVLSHSGLHTLRARDHRWQFEKSIDRASGKRGESQHSQKRDLVIRSTHFPVDDAPLIAHQMLIISPTDWLCPRDAQQAVSKLAI